MIADHIMSLLPPPYRIWQMVLYFKIGLDKRLYLLWCGNMQLINGDSSESTKTRVPRTPLSFPSRPVGKVATAASAPDGHVVDNMVCPVCGRRGCGCLV
jgi:hypothetical protein